VPEVYGVKTTAAEVVRGVDLTGKAVVVTGAASGIGVETARALASTGATVTMAVRDVAAGQGVAAQLDGAVRVEELDLADLTSVDAFVARWRGPLHVLVNNAGVMNTPQGRTAQGFELQFGTNHLGHFALALGLHDALVADGAARIVSVSSSGHGSSHVVFDDLFFQRRPYDPGAAYGQSKTANVLFAVEATRRWAADGITANALMPGGIFTGLQRHWDPDVLAAAKADYGEAKTPEQGAATSVWVATAPELAGIGGRYYEDCHQAELVPQITDGVHGVVAWALDPDAARQLWDVSLTLLTQARAG